MVTCAHFIFVDKIGQTCSCLQYLYKWLQSVSKTHFEVILSCLLPHPIEYARVGGHWYVVRISSREMTGLLAVQPRQVFVGSFQGHTVEQDESDQRGSQPHVLSGSVRHHHLRSEHCVVILSCPSQPVASQWVEGKISNVEHSPSGVGLRDAILAGGCQDRGAGRRKIRTESSLEVSINHRR